MDLGFDHAAWPHAQRDAAEDCAEFDWHGLRARFLAAQACRGEFGPDCAAPQAGGSFNPAAAAALADFEGGTPGINPNGLGDRKGDRDKWETTPGQRGPAIEGDDD
jgi:hypothetical protein